MTEQKPFRFGVQAYQAGSAKEWRDTVQRAETLGYSSLHLADHYFGPGRLEAETGHPVQTLAAVPAIAMAAEATDRIRVGCRVFCIDYHLPAVLAKEAATLDLLSEGRLELGLGAGWIRAEYEAMGVRWDPAPARIDRLEEVVALVKAHFDGEQIDMSGRHVRVSGYAGVPQPVQRPRPPIMIGGGAQRVLTLAGREADIVSLNFNNSAGRLGPGSVQSSTAEETARKIGWIRDGAGDRFAGIELEIAAYFTNVTADGAAQTAAMAAGFGLEPAQLAEHPHVLVGSVAEIADRLVERRERYGISYVTVGAKVMDDFAPVVERLSGR
ncbi:MAG TPA: TIGR03621 family F420-dependent LLM class oxidoreductase [Acidimicrobiales bacterium]|nr:TIGR03621 family F420-dependent LLM class oxidoreductase [Acidimicrobiales bacterium]